MRGSLAPDNPTVREFQSDVVSVDARDVVLDGTYFYAESGGQPADRGKIAGEDVIDVQEVDGDVVHTLAEPAGFDAGDAVECVVDDEFRTYCMRAHTASHALYGAGRQLLDDLGYGGFGIGDEKVRVDFTTSTDIDDSILVELERLTNRAVWNARPVAWEEVPVDEARGREEVAFNTKTEEGVMADADTVRVVTIEGWDAAACGGTHVSNTLEIGPVTVLERSNPGEGLTRVEFAVGPAGIDRNAEVHGAALDAASELGTRVTDLPDAIGRVAGDRDQLQAELEDLKAQVLDARLDDLSPIEKDGTEWLVGTVTDFGPNEVGDHVKGMAGDRAEVVAVAGAEGSTFVVVAAEGEVAAGDVVDAVTDEFGGGGGGSPSFAQGGGLSADPEAVAGYLREE